jgi:hypothetical protein
MYIQIAPFWHWHGARVVVVVVVLVVVVDVVVVVVGAIIIFFSLMLLENCSVIKNINSPIWQNVPVNPVLQLQV